MTISEEGLRLLELMLIPGIRAGSARHLLTRKKAEGWKWEDFWFATERELMERFGVPRRSIRWIVNKRKWVLEERQRVVKRLREVGAFVVASEDAAYPEALRRMPDYPPLLVMKGNSKLVDLTKMGLLSSRNPSWRDVALIGKVILGLRDCRVAIVSGAGAIQHYVPGYWGLLAEVPVIWVLDRGILMAFGNRSGEHLAPFARMDGRLWNEELELAISPFSPEDVGTPAGMLLRDRVVAWLSDHLVGWGLRANGNAMKVLRERYESGAPVTAVVRQRVRSRKMAGTGVPIVYVERNWDEWKNWLSGNPGITRESQIRLAEFIRAFLRDADSMALIDLDLPGLELLDSEGNVLKGKLWLRESQEELRKSNLILGGETRLFPGDLWKRMSSTARKILLVSGKWEEMVPIGEWAVFEVGAKLVGADKNEGGVSEPVRDYGVPSPIGYRRAHAKMWSIWKREVLRSADSANTTGQVPRGVAAVLYASRYISADKEFVWVFPSAGRPDWIPQFCASLGLRECDESGVPEGWERWERLGRFEART